MPKNYAQLKYHVFFGTRNEQKLLKPDLQGRVCGYFNEVLNGYGGTLFAGGGADDHVHLLIGLQPTHAVSKIVGSIKSANTAWLKNLVHGFAWQQGYTALSVSEQEANRVERYIRQQEKYHRTTTFEEERRRFLELHGLDIESKAEYPRTTHSWLRHHIVFSTKNRLELISPDIESKVYSSIEEKIQELDGEPIEIGGMPDHLHILVATKPKHTMAEIIHDIKGSSSRCLAHHTPFEWQVGYSVFSVSRSQEDVVRRYIQNQKEYHRGVSSTDELHSLIRQHHLKARDINE